MELKMSASQLSQFMGCQRKWGYRRIDGLLEPQSPKAAAGVAFHRELELWLKQGIKPASRVVQAVLEHFPEPGVAEAEIPISYRLASGPYVGRIDAGCSKAPDGSYVYPQAGLPFVLFDLKTTTSVEYAKDPEELRNDVAANLYAYEALLAGATTVYGKWVYVQTKGKPHVKVVDFFLGDIDVHDRMVDFERSAQNAQQLYRIRKKTDELPRNTKNCFAYNSRCHYYLTCQPVSVPIDELTAILEEDEQMPSQEDFMKDMATAYPKKVPPPLPPKKVPPLPAKPAVPAVEHAVVKAAESALDKLEEAVAEKYAGFVDAELKAERGYVNSPENPFEGQPLALTPEEAAAQQGIKPVTDEPQDDLDTKNKYELLEICRAMGIVKPNEKTKMREPGMKAAIRAKRLEAEVLAHDEPPNVQQVELEPTIMESVREALDGLDKLRFEELSRVLESKCKELFSAQAEVQGLQARLNTLLDDNGKLMQRVDKLVEENDSLRKGFARNPDCCGGSCKKTVVEEPSVLAVPPLAERVAFIEEDVFDRLRALEEALSKLLQRD